MSLADIIFTVVNRLFPARTAYAHCDIPCGIYDPHLAQVAAHTVLRMNKLAQDLPKPGPSASPQEMETYASKLSRYTSTQDEHAELCKRELRILWGDYFKPEHVQQHPKLHDLFWNAMKQGSAARQNYDAKAAEPLLASTQEIAEIFWRTKGANPVRKPSLQPTGGEIVYPA